MTKGVLIADDHPMMRLGVRTELARHADIEDIGEATNGDDAAQLTESLLPDVLVLDIQMPGLAATEVIQQARSLVTPVRVLILTAHDDIGNVRDMLAAGATGYLLKDEAPEVIADAIRAVAEGKTWLSDEVAQMLARFSVKEAQELTQDKLSLREMEVLQLLAKGSTNLQIAEVLAISEGTVKNHLVSIYAKMGVHTRAEAVAWAWQRGAM